MHPTTRGARIFTAYSIEWKLLSPHRGRRPCSCLRSRTHRRTVFTLGAPFVYVLDVGGKHAGLHVRTSRSEQHIVRMPINREYGGTDGFLELLRDPPVVVRIEGTNRDRPERLGKKTS